MYLFVGVSHHLEFCSPAVARAVMVCHIFCCSLFMLANCRIRSVLSFILFHYTPSLTPLLPTARKSCHSFAHFVPFHSFHFQGICLFPPTNPCGCSRVPFHSTPLHHRTHTPFPFIRSNTLHSFITSSPCFFQRTVRAKKCAKPAAGSTRPPRSALPVSGALAPLAAARTQRTG